MNKPAVNIVSISGGKDSTATALVAVEREVENLRFVFSDTGHEHQATYDYVEYLSGELKRLCGRGIDRVSADFTHQIAIKRASLISHLTQLSEMGNGNNRLKDYTAPMLERMIDNLKPSGNPFLDLCILKGRFPGTRSRFCSQRLKHEPLDEYHQQYIAGHQAVISWQGVRADESAARADLPEKDVEFGSWEPEPVGMLIYRPIIQWKAEATFTQHTKMGVKWNPLYEKGMGRVGCMPCIHARKSEVREIQRRFPEEIERVAEWERIVSLAAKREASTFMDARITAKFLGTGKTINDISAETHGIHTYSEWASTARGGKQYDLINVLELENVPVCSSVYGLCE